MIDPRVAFSTQPTFGLFTGKPKNLPQKQHPWLTVWEQWSKMGRYIDVFFCIFAPFSFYGRHRALFQCFQTARDWLSKSNSRDNLWNCPDFINDLAKKTKHVRISFQWPGGPARIEYEWWLDRTKLEDQEETLLHRCQKWSKFNLCSFRKMKRNGGNIWTKSWRKINARLTNSKKRW